MNRSNSTRPCSYGFTFTELLVIVALAVVLGAMILPSLNSASDMSKAAVCVGNMHVWSMALNMYSEDWNDWFPFEGIFGTSIDTVGSPPYPGNLNAWFNVIPHYINQPRLVDLYYAGKPPLPDMKSVWICPAATSTVTSAQITLSHPYFSYAFNARMDPNNSCGYDCRYRRSQLTSPSNTIVFCESDGVGGTVGATTTVAHHFGGANFVLGDGHVEWIKYDDYCRSCPSNLTSGADSSGLGDWAPGTKYHWFPFRGAPT